MKKIILILFISFNTYANNLYQILIDDSKNAVDISLQLNENIKNNQDFKESFNNLVINWKKVQSHYILGNFNEEFLDAPRYLDIFNIGNENIYKQLDLIIDNNDDLAISLYKNSHKTINALEYILYKKDLNNKRVKDIALIITNNITTKLNNIYNGYLQYQNTKNKDTINAWIITAITDSVYFLHSWRVGNPAGLSKKYKNKANNSRAEYHLSNNSFKVINAILESQLNIIKNIDNKTIKSNKLKAIKLINKMLKINQNNTSFVSNNTKQIYNLSAELLDLYYDEITKKLKGLD